MEGDIANMGQFIGAGIAGLGTGLAALGVGNVAGNFLAGALRNPSAAAGQNREPFSSASQFAEAHWDFSFSMALPADSRL